MIARERLLGWMIAIVFIAGGIIGGGPTSVRLSMFVELLACCLGALAVAGAVNGEYPRQARAALILLALICLVPVLQLIPLPVALWKALPGHQIPAAISQLAGLGELARPMSLDPEHTRLAALSLIVPAAVFTAALGLDARNRDLVMAVIVVFAAISAVLGGFQVASGGGLDLGIYPLTHDGYPIGFFANRNHEADLLLIAIPMAVHLVRLRPWSHQAQAAIATAAVLFFLLSVVATASRTAFALSPLALAGALIVWFGDARDRRIWIGIANLIAISAVIYLLLSFTPAGHRLIHRFADASDDLRHSIWRNTWPAIKSFWPIGSGTGSFVPVYDMFEDLDSVGPAWINHAHNDYLELLLENGAISVLLLAVYIILLVINLFRSPPSPLRGQRYVGVTSILILLSHSAVDYPLRTFGLIAAFAFSNGLIFPPRDARRLRRSGSYAAVPAPPAFAQGTPDA